MINILLDKLPNITPNGYEIRTDFRNCIEFEILMQDNEINENDKLYLSLEIFYKDINKIDSLENALKDIVWFYSLGKSEKEDSKKVKKEDNKNLQQIYSYEHDDKLIYSAFLEQYNIDLNEAKLHWWKFKALFEGLSDKTKIVEIMGYRAVDLGKIKDKDEKLRYKKLKQIYALPDMRTAEEKENSFGSAFW